METDGRIVSLDTLRGLVIMLMIFVNDVAGVSAAPGWLKHVGAKADAMTLPDIVFPAFLFIAGMSIPLAMQRALSAGQSRWQLGGKVLTRTLSLLMMGVVMVNMESHNPGVRGLWGILAYLALFLAFPVVPRSPDLKRRMFQIARVVGAILLIVLVLVYRTQDGKHLILGPLFDSTDTVWLRHSWWGILGLIAWAYGVAALIYLALGHRREWLVGMIGLLAMLYVADHQGLFSRIPSRDWLIWASPMFDSLKGLFDAVNRHVSVGQSLGSLASITVAGCCLGSILTQDSDLKTHAQRLRWALMFAVGLAVGALLFDPLFGINKIQATPTWCLLCASLTALAWVLLYSIMDVWGVKSWSVVLQPAGTNPLMAYMLHPLILMIAGFIHVPIGFYKDSTLPLWINLLGCLVMALAVVGLTGLITRLGYRMKA